MTIKGRTDSCDEDPAVILPEHTGQQPIRRLAAEMLAECLDS